VKKEPVPAAVPAQPYELQLLRDPEIAAAYLTFAVADDDLVAFLHVLRNVTEATGVSKIAARTGLSRRVVSRTLSRESTLKLRSLTKILHASGIRLQFVARRAKRGAGRAARTAARWAAWLDRVR
jgi:probable addiction module antidote protein